MSTLLDLNIWGKFIPLSLIVAACIGFAAAAPKKGKRGLFTRVAQSTIFRWSYIIASAIATMAMAVYDSFFGITELASHFVMQGDSPVYESFYTVVLLGGVMIMMVVLLYAAIHAGAFLRPKNIQFETFSWSKREVKTGLVHPTEIAKQFAETDFGESKYAEATIKVHPKPDPLADSKIAPVQLALNPEVLDQ